MPTEVVAHVPSMRGGGNLELRLPNAIGRIHAHEWSGDGRRVLAWSATSATVVDGTTGAELVRFSLPAGQLMTGATLSHDARHVVISSVVAGANPSVEQADVYEVETGRHVPLQLPVRNPQHNSLWQLLPGASAVVVLRPGKGADAARAWLSLFDLSTQKQMASLLLPGDWSDSKTDERDLVVSPDGSVAAVGHASRISFVRFANGDAQEFTRLAGSSRVVFSPDSRRAAWIQVRGIGLWNAKDGSRKLLMDSRCTPDSVPFPGLDVGLFNPSGKFLASPGAGCACVWDTEVARVAAVLTKPRALDDYDDFPLPAVAWVRTDKGLITNDGTLWNLATRQRVLSELQGWAPLANASLVLRAETASGTYQISELDDALRGTSKGHVTCELDTNATSKLVQVEDSAIVGCRPLPLAVIPSKPEPQSLNISDWREMTETLPHRHFAVVTTFGLLLAEPTSGKRIRSLVSDLGHGRGRSDQVTALRFYGKTLELVSSELDQRIMQRRIELSERQLHLVTGLHTVSRCQDREPTLLRDLKYASARSRDRSVTLCEAATGRVVARLPEHESKVVFTAAPGERAFVVDTGSESKLWLPQQSKLLPLQGSDALRWHFGARRLLAGELSAMRVNVYEADSARRIATWPIENHYSHLLAIDEENDWALLGDSSVLEMRRLANGAPLGRVAFGDPVAAAIGPAGLVVVSDGQRLWFMRAPMLEPLGELLIDGERALFADVRGAFETNGEHSEVWQSELGCQRGQEEVVFDLCRRRLHRAGLMRDTLFGH